MQTEIKFGTDGFRGIIGKDFNFDTVKKITLALAQYMQTGTVIIGYDPRLDADKYAKYSSEILAMYGFDVLLSECIVPTPVIALAARNIKNSSGALMFTASHNPSNYLGIKFIPNYGGPATKEITTEIENLIKNKTFTLEEKEGVVLKKDFSKMYFEEIDKLIDFDSIKNNPPKIIYDGLFSASIGYFDKILKEKNIEFEAFNNCYDPDFGGFLPEPKPEFLKHTKQGHITVANDGDADRYGVIDEQGNYVSPNIILAILLKYLKEKGMEGAVVKTVGVSSLIDVVAEKLNIETIETPVGFKWISEAMRLNKTIIGGEDSGGLTTGNHIPEEIIDFAGVEFVQDRVDIKLDDDIKKEQIIARIDNEENFANQKIIQKNKTDGIKLYLEDNLTKILIRKSGTEPLLRFYVETDKNSKLASIKEFIKGYMFIVK